MNSEPVTPAQEIVTCAMLSTLIASFAANYILLSLLTNTTLYIYTLLAIGTFVTVSYITPRLTAAWIGRPLDDIMNPDTTVETHIDTTDNPD